MANELELQRLAARQYGLASRQQILDLRFTARQIDRRVLAHQWRRVAPRVFDVAPAAPHARRPVMAAVLESGGAAAYRSAANLHGLLENPPVRAEIIVPYGNQPRGLSPVKVHRSRTIAPTDIEVIEGIPCTTVLRTIVDLSTVVGCDRLDSYVAKAIRRHRLNITELLDISVRPSPGHTGIGRLRMVLEPYAVDKAMCESELERLLFRSVCSGALVLPQRQHLVRIGRDQFRLDTAWPDEKVFVEADGLAFHIDRAVFERDRSRQNRLVRAGWLPLRYTWPALTKRAADTVAEITAVVEARRAALRRAG